MLKNIDVSSGAVRLIFDNRRDLLTFRGYATLVDPSLMVMNEASSVSNLSVTYHVPEGDQEFREPRTGDILGRPEAGNTEYSVTLRLPPLVDESPSGAVAALTGRADPDAPFEICYEVMEELANIMARPTGLYDMPPLLNAQMKEDMKSALRGLPGFKAVFTLFYPERQDPLFTVTTRLGGLIFNFNTSHPEYRQDKVQAAMNVILEAFGEKPRNISSGFLRLSNPLHNLSSLEKAADALVENGLLAVEQKAGFLEDVRSMRLSNFAANQVKYAQANVQIAGHSREQLEDSRAFARIMTTLAETGDFSALSPQDLLNMRQVGKGYYSGYGAKDQIWSEGLIREMVRITGRSDEFKRLCLDYLPEIETAIVLTQVQGTASLPRNPDYLARVSTMRDPETEKSMFDEWANAGDYERITETAAQLATASGRDLRGRNMHDLVAGCLTEGPVWAYERKEGGVGIVTLLSGDANAIRALLKGLAAKGENPVLEGVASFVEKAHPELLPLLCEVRPEAQRDGPGAHSASIRRQQLTDGPGWPPK